MMGNVFIGATVTASPSGSVFMRVMHMRRGRPLISAEHEPHLPALQFQRQARSWAWLGLDAVDDVEHDLALDGGHDVVDELTALVVTAPDPHGHLVVGLSRPPRTGPAARAA